MEETWRWFGPDDIKTRTGDCRRFVVNALLNEEQQHEGLPPARRKVPMRPDHGQTTCAEKLDKRVRPGYSYSGHMQGLAELRGVIYALRANRS